MRSTKELSVDPEETRSENRVLGMSVFRGQENEEEVGKEENIQDNMVSWKPRAPLFLRGGGNELASAAVGQGRRARLDWSHGRSYGL